MNEQLNLFGEKMPSKKGDNVRRNWNNRFQRWSDTQSQDGTTSLGICGNGSMCDYCADNTYGNPCVRALNCMLKEKGLTIDYLTADYEAVWDGTYFRKEDSKYG